MRLLQITLSRLVMAQKLVVVPTLAELFVMQKGKTQQLRSHILMHRDQMLLRTAKVLMYLDKILRRQKIHHILIYLVFQMTHTPVTHLYTVTVLNLTSNMEFHLEEI